MVSNGFKIVKNALILSNALVYHINCPDFYNDQYSRFSTNIPTDKNAKTSNPSLDHNVRGHSHCTAHSSSKSHSRGDTPRRAACLHNSDLEVFGVQSIPPLSFPKQHIHFHANEEPRCCLHVQREDCRISSTPKSNHRKTRCSLFELLHLCTTRHTTSYGKQVLRGRKIENHHRHEKDVDWNTYSRRIRRH